jgi:hypothetical protein
MAQAADYLQFSTQQVEAAYKLRTRNIQSQQVTITNVAEYYRITVLIDDTFEGATITPNQIVLEPKESKTFTVSYDISVLETLPSGLIPSKINFTATAEVIRLPPPPPPPPIDRPLPPPLIYLGCTDPTALNYSRKATNNDGSCIQKVIGCTNPNASNYNPAANVDDGSCRTVVITPRETPGCTVIDSLNYNPQATVNDGSCIPIVVGCRDINAANYNPSANVDGVCIPREDTRVFGCTDISAFNYNPRANANDGTCEYDRSVDDPIPGCTRAGATNYNPLATVDDGSCVLPVIVGCMDTAAINYNLLATQNDINNPCQYHVYGCTNPQAANFNRSATRDDGTCVFIGCKNPISANYDPSPNIVPCPNDSCCIPQCPPGAPCSLEGEIASQGPVDDNGYAVVCRYIQNTTGTCPSGCDTRCAPELVFTRRVGGCTRPECINYNPLATVDDGSCDCEVRGCTDTAANNYNPRANTDDGSCVYPIIGCMDPSALNYDPRATQSGPCTPVVTGCMDPKAANYNQFANRDDGSCYTITCPAAGTRLGCTQIGFDLGTISAGLNININLGGKVQYLIATADGNCGVTYDYADSCTGERIEVYGCTDSTATNYNPNATSNVGVECIYEKIIDGCTDVNAANYNPLANRNDGSCITCEPAGRIIRCIPVTGGYGTVTTYIVEATNGSCGTEQYESSSCGGSGGGGSATEVETTLLTGTVGGGTVEEGGVVTANLI